MTPTRKISVALPNSVRIRLESLAADARIDLDAYASMVLSNHVVGFPSSPQARGGRPVSVQPDDLPADVERAQTATGFVGVTKNGRLFAARAGKVAIGRFSTAELAAAVRYFAVRGFRIGRGAMFHDAGVPVDDAIELAARAGFTFEAKPSEGRAMVEPEDPRQLCLVCKDTGKMPIRGVAGGTGRWWPCECPASVNVDKPTEWDVTGKPMHEERI